MAKRKIDAQTEVRIVALLARGDTYKNIKQTLEDEGVLLSISGITDIKQRNSMALEQIKSSLVQHETSKATRILDKAKKHLEQKLDSIDNYEERVSILKNKHESGEIDGEQYKNMSMMLRDDASVTIKDLVTVSKEMFNQSQIESNKPTSITSNPEENKRNLLILLKAINDKDEVGMLKSIFPDA